MQEMDQDQKGKGEIRDNWEKFPREGRAWGKGIMRGRSIINRVLNRNNTNILQKWQILLCITLMIHDHNIRSNKQK